MTIDALNLAAVLATRPTAITAAVAAGIVPGALGLVLGLQLAGQEEPAPPPPPPTPAPTADIETPDFRGLGTEDARALARIRGLVLDERSLEAGPDETVGTVGRQSPEAGAPIARGGTVVVWTLVRPTPAADPDAAIGEIARRVAGEVRTVLNPHDFARAISEALKPSFDDLGNKIAKLGTRAGGGPNT